MAGDPKQKKGGLFAPQPGPPARRAGTRAGARRGKQGGPDDPSETAAHAKEVREVIRGRDIVDKPSARAEQKPAQFKNADLLVVRSWLMRRPLEPTAPAAALVSFPRLWSTKRGRYCRFQAPGAGSYGILRARPSF